MSDDYERRVEGRLWRMLERAQPGTQRAIRAHIRRAVMMAVLIHERWPEVEYPEQWRVKHLRWALEYGLSDRSPGTRYNYYRSARVVAAQLGRAHDWEPYLRGPWLRPDGRLPDPDRRPGGRRPKLSARYNEKNDST